MGLRSTDGNNFAHFNLSSKALRGDANSGWYRYAQPQNFLLIAGSSRIGFGTLFVSYDPSIVGHCRLSAGGVGMHRPDGDHGNPWVCGSTTVNNIGQPLTYYSRVNLGADSVQKVVRLSKK